MKDSDILKKARQLIESEQERWICMAIGQAARRNTVQGNSLISWVEKMLGDCAFYSSWLATHHRELHDTVVSNWYKNRDCSCPWKEGRLQWLDWMIAECEKEEAKA